MNTKQKIGTVLPLLKADVNVITSTIMQMEKIYNNKRVTMKKLLKFFTTFIISLALFSCASSQSATTVAKGNDVSRYKYVVFGSNDEGDAELADILMMVQNDISEKLQVVSSEKARSLIYQGEKVLSPRINVKTEKWDGGHTYISISFYDYDTNQSVAVIKSSGIGLTISHDQKLAYKALKKELDKTFR